MKNIDKHNEKSVMNFLNSNQIDKSEFLKFFNKLKPKDL